ncbi:GNAT family N-acetyltransferase [Actinomadura miaoliensis]|uniref:GNAT family N-acetyltransferase n=1 Tax=Actinomadura miaoliensis TaxID=430685 RepID=A0ABP7VBR0_9ACTN
MTVFDRLVDQAWPAAHVEDAHGWRLRYAHGVTKRANSVWPAAEPPDLPAAVEAAERFYYDRGLPAVFSVSPWSRPSGLDDMLQRRGYTVADPTLVMTADLAADRPVTREVAVAGTPSGTWLDTWWSVDGRHPDALPAATGIITGVPAAYATLGDSVGRAVLQGDWLGVYCMATAPHARRQGLAREVLHALLNHGRAQGARRAYLCVTERNTAAQALYTRAGFVPRSRYHYRVRARA